MAGGGRGQRSGCAGRRGGQGARRRHCVHPPRPRARQERARRAPEPGVAVPGRDGFHREGPPRRDLCARGGCARVGKKGLGVCVCMYMCVAFCARERAAPRPWLACSTTAAPRRWLAGTLLEQRAHIHMQPSRQTRPTRRRSPGHGADCLRHPLWRRLCHRPRRHPLLCRQARVHHALLPRRCDGRRTGVGSPASAALLALPLRVRACARFCNTHGWHGQASLTSRSPSPLPPPPGIEDPNFFFQRLMTRPYAQNIVWGCARASRRQRGRKGVRGAGSQGLTSPAICSVHPYPWTPSKPRTPHPQAPLLRAECHPLPHP